MLTKAGKALTAKGIKPICTFQQVFKSTYVFGAFSPINGSSLLLELPACNANAFQTFLNHLSKQDETELKIMVLDNGAFHKASSLVIPDNIALIFLPPYSPELNPAEKIWARLKKAFSNRLFKTLDDLSVFIQEHATKLEAKVIQSTCRFKYITDAKMWAKL